MWKEQRPQVYIPGWTQSWWATLPMWVSHLDSPSSNLRCHYNTCQIAETHQSLPSPAQTAGSWVKSDCCFILVTIFQGLQRCAVFSFNGGHCSHCQQTAPNCQLIQSCKELLHQKACLSWAAHIHQMTDTEIQRLGHFDELTWWATNSPEHLVGLAKVWPAVQSDFSLCLILLLPTPFHRY